MQRAPPSSHTLIQTDHILASDLPVLRSRVLQQQLHFLQYLRRLEIPYTHCFHSAIEVVSLQNGVVVWSWGEVEFDGRVAGSETG